MRRDGFTIRRCGDVVIFFLRSLKRIRTSCEVKGNRETTRVLGGFLMHFGVKGSVKRNSETRYRVRNVVLHWECNFCPNDPGNRVTGFEK